LHGIVEIGITALKNRLSEYVRAVASPAEQRLGELARQGC
jgi:antitoxin (DNA-binding transcriptional repressor) of toxin-antitoxin stability system